MLRQMRSAVAALLVALSAAPAAADENDHACEVILRECGYGVPEEQTLCAILTHELGCAGPAAYEDTTGDDAAAVEAPPEEVTGGAVEPVTAPEAWPAPAPALEPPAELPAAPAPDYATDSGSSAYGCPVGTELYDVLSCSCYGTELPVPGSGSCAPCAQVGITQECR
jgi:hypothetical protein